LSLSSLIALPAHAYIGPGLGAGTIGVVLGVLASFFIALFAVIYYPIKRRLKKRTQPSNVAKDIGVQPQNTERAGGA
jgi:hypothetical protein